MRCGLLIDVYLKAVSGDKCDLPIRWCRVVPRGSDIQLTGVVSSTNLF
jgi:hypothetical protein